VFLGHGKAHTGGVRVINRNQTVRDNYFEGIAGDNFAAALSVMAGTHDAPLNRYEQIDHAVIERNSFIQVGTLLLGAGLDEERNAMPVNSRIAGNLFIGDGKRDLLRTQGDLSGITFVGNVQSPAVSAGFPGGVRGQSLTLQRAPNGLLYPTTAVDAGAPRDLAPIARDQVGVDWYPKTLPATALDSGAVRQVAPGEDTLTAAVAASSPGDRLQLQRGRYTVSQVLAVDHPLSVLGPARGQASVQFTRPSLFEIGAGGSLRLARLDIDGALAPDAAGNAVIRVPPGSQAFNYTLLVDDSRVHGLTANKAFDVIATGKGSLAARIALSNVTVEDISGSVIAAAAETDDLGTYNAEQVDLLDSRFRRIGGPVLNLYRGGTDESTFGPALQVRGNQFEQVGVADDTSLRLHGVQFASIRDNRFDRSGRIRFSHRDNPLTATAPLLSDTPVEALP